MEKISYTSELTHYQLDIFRVGILLNTGRKKLPQLSKVLNLMHVMKFKKTPKNNLEHE